MKIKDVRETLEAIYGQLSIARMEKQDRLLRDKIDQWLALYQDDDELSFDILAIFIEQVLDDASPHLIELIKSLEVITSSFDYMAELTLTLKKHGLLRDTDNVAYLFQCSRLTRRSLYALVRLVEAQGKPLTQQTMDVFFDFFEAVEARQPTVQRLVPLAQAASLHAFTEFFTDTAGLSDIEFLPLVAVLLKHDVIARKKIPVLLAAPRHDLCYLEKLVNALAEHQLLNRDSYGQAYDAVFSTLRPVTLSEVKKESRQSTGEERSKLVVTTKHHRKVTFYIEHNTKKEYLGGTYGKVKAGFEKKKGRVANVAVKKITHLDAVTAEQIVKREVKYHKLLGGQPCFFRHHDHYYMVMDWKRGVELRLANPLVLESYAQYDRLKCLVSGLTDLVMLHSHHRVHGDVKPENCMLDLTKLRMRLIDFGSTHRNYLKDQYVGTLLYSDGYSFSSQFCDDMYGMGYIVVDLFPELFAMGEDGTIHRLVNQADCLETAIYALRDAMMHPDRDKRCRSDDALTFCKALMGTDYFFDHAKLQTLLASTIARPQVDVTDVLRGRLKA